MWNRDSLVSILHSPFSIRAFTPPYRPASTIRSSVFFTPVAPSLASGPTLTSVYPLPSGRKIIGLSVNGSTGSDLK